MLRQENKKIPSNARRMLNPCAETSSGGYRALPFCSGGACGAALKARRPSCEFDDIVQQGYVVDTKTGETEKRVPVGSCALLLHPEEGHIHAKHDPDQP